MTEASSNTTLICIPTYNEKDNIHPLIQAIFQAIEHVDLLIVDDASPDGTGEIADEIASKDSRVKVKHRQGKQGLASAYTQAFSENLESYEQVMSMDADFSHDPKHLPSFLQAAKDYDFVIGSRYIEGGGTINWGLSRQLISRGGNTYARIFLGTPYKDMTGGFNLYKSAVLKKVGLENVRSEGYAFQIEMKYACHKAGFRGCEVPIIFEDRRVGQSKMSSRIVAEAMLKVPFLRCR